MSDFDIDTLAQIVLLNERLQGEDFIEVKPHLYVGFTSQWGDSLIVCTHCLKWSAGGYLRRERFMRDHEECQPQCDDVATEARKAIIANTSPTARTMENWNDRSW